jgi:hypothetical protein
LFTVRRYPSNSARVDSRSVSGDRTEAAKADVRWGSQTPFLAPKLTV